MNIRLNKNSKDTKLQADIESEKLIKNIISSESIYPILGEETGGSKKILVKQIIDPLDLDL